MTDRTTIPLGIIGVQHLAEAIGGHSSLALAHKHDRDRVEAELVKAERLAGQIQTALHRLRVLNEELRCAEFEEGFTQRYGGSNVAILTRPANQDFTNGGNHAA